MRVEEEEAAEEEVDMREEEEAVEEEEEVTKEGEEEGGDTKEEGVEVIGEEEGPEEVVGTEEVEVEEALATTTVVPASPSATEPGGTASISPAAVTCAWRRSALATKMIPPRSTLVSTLRSTMTSPWRLLVLGFQSP